MFADQQEVVSFEKIEGQVRCRTRPKGQASCSFVSFVVKL
jgi:hypothetical protein